MTHCRLDELIISWLHKSVVLQQHSCYISSSFFNVTLHFYLCLLLTSKRKTHIGICIDEDLDIHEIIDLLVIEGQNPFK